MQRSFAIAAACMFLAAQGAAQGSSGTGAAPVVVLGATPPGGEPEPFLPALILKGVHSAPAITPDGREMYWSRYYRPEGGRSRVQHIFVSRWADGSWSPPETAPFSGRYSDGGPFISSDASKLFFYSNRPATPGGTPSDEYISDIWYVERHGADWGEPQRLPFNTDQHEGTASVASNGNLYFQSNRRGTRGIFDIYVSEWIDGAYVAPENLGPAVNCRGINFSPLVAPDESFLIIAYSNNAPGNGLHISFRMPGGGWTRAVSMGPEINAAPVQRFPGLTPDGSRLFFTRTVSGSRVLYWVDSGIIDELRTRVLAE